ncbi:hypothetical protein IQ31_01084, partial [Sphingobacterium siyangense]
MPNDICIERGSFPVCFLKIKEEDNSVICLRKLRAISTTWLWSLNLYTY